MNNVLAVNNNNTEEVRISSREVAEMLEVSRHADMLRKIEGLEGKLILNADVRLVDYWVETAYTDASGKVNREYLVSQIGCELLAHKSTGSKGVTFTLAYIKRFKEMEEALKPKMSKEEALIQQFGLPSTYRDALIMLVEAGDEKHKLQIESEEKSKALAIVTPKANLYDAIMSSKNLYAVTDIAKSFAISGLGRNNMYRYLREEKVIIPETYEAYQQHIDRGICKQVIVTYKRTNGKSYTESLCRFTPKGLLYLHKKLVKDGYILGTDFEKAVTKMESFGEDE